MSVLTTPPPVKAFMAVFSRDGEALMEAAAGMTQFMGREPDLVSPEFPVVETDYYEPEMGRGLFKRYLSWPGLCSPEWLVGAKFFALNWEGENTADGRRLVNLDPGYISDGGLVLSTGKYRGHRLYLGRGVWGELTLHYHLGAFEGFPWTYPDYLNPAVQEQLLQMRRLYLKELRDARDGA